MTDIAIILDNRKYRPVLEKEGGCCANSCPLFRKLPDSHRSDCATRLICKALADQAAEDAFGWRKAHFDDDTLRATRNWHVVWMDCGEEY